MWLLIVYIVLGGAWIYAAYDASDGSLFGFVFNIIALIFGLFLMIGVGKVVDFFFDGVVGRFCNLMSRYDKDPSPATNNEEYIEHVDGEVVGEELYPALCAQNPTPSKRIANKRTYFGGGGVFFANWMWCDTCSHTSLHSYVDGTWVCQAPTHH